MRIARPHLPVVLGAVLLGGCVAGIVRNDPVNQPLTAMASATLPLTTVREIETVDNDIVVGLAFSGGGTRAAAFSFGVLQELDNIGIRGRAGTASLLDRVDFVTGVSGGSVTAAYFGLKKRAALDDFRERFLLRNAEEILTTDVNLLTLSRGLEGGINDATRFPKWLDENLLEGATFSALKRNRRPIVWINAADIYNRTPFVFGSGPFFGALCSDISNYPISLAVAASAAVPIVFAPIVVQNYSGECPPQNHKWVERLRRDPSAPPLLRSFADAIGRYQSGEVRFVKLLDGGLVDNFGLSAFTIARMTSDAPYGPMGPREAAQLRRMLILVVDAGRAPSGDWAQSVAGPRGVELISATADTATAASSAQSFTAFEQVISDWSAPLMQWRCALSAAERRRYELAPGWDCRDVKFYVGRVSFDGLDPARTAQLNQVPTRFTLPAEQVDLVVQAGRDALRTNRTFINFMKIIRRGPSLVPRPERAPDAQAVSSLR
jgi:NTE family protein